MRIEIKIEKYFGPVSWNYMIGLGIPYWTHPFGRPKDFAGWDADDKQFSKRFISIIDGSRY